MMRRSLWPASLAFCFLNPLAGIADHDFEYENVTACGPEIVSSIPYGHAGRDYIVIHDNKAGDQFSIVSNGYEYSSFKRMHYTELYVQRGGEKWLEFEKLEGASIRFELHDDQSRYQKYVTVITVHTDFLTAERTFSWKDEPLSLVCWNYAKS